MDQKEYDEILQQLSSGRFASLSAALGYAMTLCAVWRLMGQEKVFNPLDMIGFATQYDRAHPLPTDGSACYVVSTEGAIGVFNGTDTIDCIFVPVFDRAAMLDADAEWQALQEKPEPLKAKYCTQCGHAFTNPAAKFCFQCGAPRYVQDGAKEYGKKHGKK